MRAFVWFIRLVLFILLFGFALKNDHAVDLRFFSEKSWSFPLAFIILVALAVGSLMGVMVTVLRQQREISRLRKQLARAELVAEQAADELARLSESP